MSPFGKQIPKQARAERVCPSQEKGKHMSDAPSQRKTACPTDAPTAPTLDLHPLSSACLRLSVRPVPATSEPSGPDTRPFSLRHAVAVARPVVPAFRFCERQQVAVTDDGCGVPLLLVSGKDWRTKAKSDGDEGEEEDYGWEEK